MIVTLNLNQDNSITATDKADFKTVFDSTMDKEGPVQASSPMVIMLEAMAACSFMDVNSILKKKRKQVEDLKIIAEGVRRDEHPRIFTNVHLQFILTSPDAELQDLNRCIELSQTKFCGASAMFQLAGCKVSWEGIVIKSQKI